ncbi:MAG TPA: glycosyltransferase family 4 protein [Candidatus Acidoferrum sp.]|nr:glycosyltransferase family 4 protein [Candidatus Acidoferrum sp.]
MKSNFSKIYRIALLSSIIDEVGAILLQDVTNVLTPLCKRIQLITVDERERISRDGSESLSFLRRLIRMFFSQIDISIRLINNAQEIDIVLVHAGGYWLILPIILSKILRKKIIISHLGGDKLFEEQINAGVAWYQTIVTFLVLGLIKFAYSITDLIACESERTTKLRVLRGFRKKTFIVGGRYVDTETFKVIAPLDMRGNTVGYIGAFKPVKGITNLISALPLIANRVPDVKFLFAGEGYLRQVLETEIKKLPASINANVKIDRWIDHNSLPSKLNQLKTLVLPSYSEGIPGIVQEAMACGTLVVATPVGGIPDIIHDEKTGFIIEQNNPTCIAQNVVKALNYPDATEISNDARALIENEFSKSLVTQRYATMLAKLAKPFS